MNAYKRNYHHSSIRTPYNWTAIEHDDISVDTKYEDDYNPGEPPLISYHVSLKEDESGNDEGTESFPRESTSKSTCTIPNPIVLLKRLSPESIKAASRPIPRKNVAVRKKRRKSDTNPRAGKATNPDGLACGVCKRIFSSKGALQLHQTIHTGIRKFECAICFRRFVRVDTLKNHLKNVHREGAPLRCPTCHITFDRLKNWRCHNLNHHSHKRSHISCTFCNKSFNSIVYRDLHEGVHPPKNSELNRPFHRIIRILNIKLSCHKRKEIRRGRLFLNKLKIVKAKFLQIRRSKLLRKILWGKELNLQKSQFKCEFCKKYFCKKWYLNVHRNNMHTREQKFSCRLCGIVFYANSLRTRHIRGSHPEHADILTPRKNKSDEKCRGRNTLPLVAYEEVVKAFKEIDEEAEEPVKIQEKRYEPQHWCNLCQEEYYNEDFLKKHQEKHVQDLPKYQYNCDSCLKVSRRRGSLILSREEYEEMLLKEKKNRKKACKKILTNTSLYEEDLDFESDCEEEVKEIENQRSYSYSSPKFLQILKKWRGEPKEIILKCPMCDKFGQHEPFIGKRNPKIKVKRSKRLNDRGRNFMKKKNTRKQIPSESQKVISRPKPVSEIPPAIQNTLAIGIQGSDSVEKERTSPIKIFQQISEMHQYNMISPLVKEVFPEEVKAGKVLRLLLSLDISERFQLLEHTDELHARILKEKLFLDAEKSI